MMAEPLKILIVEDLASDVELLKVEIARSGISFESRVVEIRKDFVDALLRFNPDIILSDYSLPRFDGLKALELRNKLSPFIPFILVTGSLNEETAVLCMKGGASDYLIKDNLTRIGYAIKTAVKSAQLALEKKKAEETLLEAEARYRSFFEKDISGDYLSTPEGILLDCNPAFARMMGYGSPSEVLAIHPANLYPVAADRDNFLETLRLNKALENHELNMKKKDGTIITCLENVVGIFDDHARLIRFQGYMVDITERKESEVKLKNSEEKFRIIFNKSPIGIELYDRNGIQLMANAASFQMFGIPDESSAGFNLFDGTSLTEPLKKKLRKGESIVYQASFDFDKVRTLNQYHTTRPGKAEMEYIITPLKSENKTSIHGYLLQVQEITSRKRAEKIQQVLFNIANAIATTSELKDLDDTIRNELGTLLDTSNFYIAYYDETTGILSTPNARDEKDCFESWPAEKSLTGAVIRDNKPILVTKDEIMDLHKRGEINLIGTTAQCWLGVPLYTEGKIMGVLAVQSYEDQDAYHQQDVDMLEFVSAQISLSLQRKKSEEALRESENKYRKIFENIQDIFYQVDTEGKIVEISPSIFRYSGYTQEELIGKPVTEVYYNPEDRNTLLKELHEKGELMDYDVRLRKKNGQITWASLNVHLIFDAAGNPTGVEGSMRNVTERKKGEEIRQVLYNISRATLLPIDVEGLIEIIRQELGKLIDTKNFFVAFYDEETKLLHAPYWKDAFDQISYWPAEKSVTGIIIRDNKSLLLKKQDILDLKSTHEIGEVEVHSECWLGVPLREGGKVIGAFVVQSYTDPEAYTLKDLEMLEFVSHQISISIQRKKAELELNSALEKAQESDRLKSVFLANMSHEIRTPMNAILGFSDLLGQADSTPEETRRFTEIIRNSGSRLMHLIDDIIDLSKLEANQIRITKSICQVNQLMQNTLTSFSNHEFLKRNKGLEMKLNLSGIKVPTETITDGIRLGQMLDNMISNALKYTTEGTIELGVEQIEQNGSPWLRFFVSDTGKGIPPDKLPIIFERFRQVEEHEYHEGAGLGLSISKALIELLGGELKVESEVGKGTLFSFTIPYEAPQAPVLSAPSHQENIPFPLKGKKILIVDDDPDSVYYLSVLLHETGAVLTIARDGALLMDMLQKEVPDLILLDINMPGKTGYECLEEIRVNGYSVKIIAQTAYAMAEEKLRCMELGCQAYLAKPFTKKELLESIKNVLLS